MSESLKLEYRPIDNQWGQIWMINGDCLISKIFWRFGRPIVRTVNCHEKLVKALNECPNNGHMRSCSCGSCEKWRKIKSEALTEAEEIPNG